MMSIIFTDEEFANACEELDEPIVDSYDKFVDSHDVKIYRQYNQISGLYSYKVFGILKGATAETCSDVYLDLEYRKKWDNYAKELTSFREDNKNCVYWQAKYPFPLANRDYTYIREMRRIKHDDGRDVFVVLSRSHQMPSHPPRSTVVRVSDYVQSIAITADDGDAQSAKAFLLYYENPGGMLPTWMINWAASIAVPAFLGQMQQACLDYPKYLEEKQ